MASLMFTDCSSSTVASRLIHWNCPTGAFLPSRSVGQSCLRTTLSRRGCNLSIRSSSNGAMVIDQGAVVEEILGEIKTEVSRMEKSTGVVPGVALIQVGERLDQTYTFSCLSAGMNPFVIHLAKDASEEEVLKSISRFNDEPCVHGIHVQSPLPLHMDEQKILNAISIEKDVDGVHTQNIGWLAMQGIEPIFAPLIPKACIELMHRHNFEINGKRAVVLGRSYKLGIPAALLLLRENATVTIIHSRTKNPEEITRQADIVISAIRQPNMVRGSWVKPGAFVINVGSTPILDGNHWTGFRPVGDICYEEVRKVASAITPDDGIGLKLTDMMRLSNVLTSAKRCYNFI